MGLRVDGTSYADAVARCLSWAREPSSRYVCIANVHMVMEAHDAEDYRRLVNAADLVTPDGMPLVWALRALGLTGQERVYGPTLMLHLCEAAAREGVPIGLYGSRPETLQKLVTTLSGRFPSLRIAYAHSPPFRSLTAEEDAAIDEQLVRSGARLLFVGLGCPRQERWMASRRGRLPLTLLGVGAAFDFHAGQVPQAPAWLQDAGLEWAFRFAAEPRRLWKRYLKHNPRFVALLARQLMRAKV